MIKRIIDISQRAYVRVKNAQLLVERDGEIVGTAPVEDIGVLILQHPAIVISQFAVIACQRNNAAIVFCDEKHLPYSLILPLGEGHTLHQKILQMQINAKKPAAKRIWKQIVRQKIAEQKKTLARTGANAAVLDRLAAKVKSGDSENHEAQAARHYWPMLFGKSFRRNREADGVNALLNYGYALMRALVARAVVSAGLHPAIGIHHRNQYNALCLADDLMEPFRPWVDWVAYCLWKENQNIGIDKHAKQSLLGLLAETVRMNGKTMPLMVACHYLAADFKKCLDGSLTGVQYPALAGKSAA